MSEKSRTVLQNNRDNLISLKEDFEEFNNPDKLILGKDDQGDNKQGDVKNSVIVLRALPVAYSRSEMQLNWKKFLSPENETGLEGTLGKRQGYTGTVSFPEATTAVVAEGDALPSSYETVDFTLQVKLQTSEELNQLLEDLENFIMPLKIKSLSMSYTDEDNPNTEAEFGIVDLTLQTYFQGKKDIEYRVESVIAGSQDTQCKESSIPPADETADETENKPEEEDE